MSFLIASCSAVRNRHSTDSKINTEYESTEIMQTTQLMMYFSLMNSMEDSEKEVTGEVYEWTLIFVVQEGVDDQEKVVFSAFPITSEEQEKKMYFGSTDAPKMIASLEKSSTEVKGKYLVEKYSSDDGTDFTGVFCRKLDAEIFENEIQRLKRRSKNKNYELFDPNPNNEIIQLYVNLKRSIEEAFANRTDKMDSLDSSESFIREIVITEMSEYDYTNEFQSAVWSIEFDTSNVLYKSIDIVKNNELSLDSRIRDRKLYLTQYESRRGNSSAFYRTYSIFRQQD